MGETVVLLGPVFRLSLHVNIALSAFGTLTSLPCFWLLEDLSFRIPPKLGWRGKAVNNNRTMVFNESGRRFSPYGEDRPLGLKEALLNFLSDRRIH